MPAMCGLDIDVPCSDVAAVSGVTVPATMASCTACDAELSATKAAMTSTPGAEMSGLRMLALARLGPRDEKSAITGAMTPGTCVAALNDAVAPAVAAYASTVADAEAARWTVGMRYGCRMVV